VVAMTISLDHIVLTTVTTCAQFLGSDNPLVPHSMELVVEGRIWRAANAPIRCILFI